MRYRHPERDVERWHSYALRAGWYESHWPTLSAIIWRESAGDPRAYNPERQARTPRGWGSYGLTQMYAWANREWLYAFVKRDLRRLYNPLVNLRAARRLHEEYGWKPWR